MNLLILNRNVRKLCLLGDYAIRVVFTDAVLCAVCGGLFGIVLGGFGAQARNELTRWWILSFGGTCALVGFAIGTVVGVSDEVSRVRNLRQKLFERSSRTEASFSGQRQSRALHGVACRGPFTDSPQGNRNVDC